MNAMENPTEFYNQTLSKAPEAVRTFYTALTKQNREMLLSCLADDFTFKGPFMDLNTPEEFAEVCNCYGGWAETEGLVLDDEKAVHIFTYHMTQPGEAKIPLCEVLTLENGKIKSSRAFADSADFPQIDHA